MVDIAVVAAAAAADAAAIAAADAAAAEAAATAEDMLGDVIAVAGAMDDIMAERVDTYDATTAGGAGEIRCRGVGGAGEGIGSEAVRRTRAVSDEEEDHCCR
jgi:hypothetical protein